MKAREGVMSNEEFGDIKKLYPVVEPNLSDSGAVDCVLEFITMAGKRSLPEVCMKTQFLVNLSLCIPNSKQNAD